MEGWYLENLQRILSKPIEKFIEEISMSEKTIVKEHIEVEIKKPKLYKVIMHNDDYTTMEFVIEMLVSYFGKNNIEATKIMLDIHNTGEGLAGIYPFDIAATKAAQVMNKAQENGFPLKLSLSEE